MRVRARLVIVSVVVIALSFLLLARQSYSVVSDVGYQALGALQYTRHEVSRVNSLRLVNPRDLSVTAECPLLLWAPFAGYAFAAGLKIGLSVGATARILAIASSLAGGMGWVWVTGLTGLGGWRRIAAVVLASLYCLRVDAIEKIGTADEFVYAIAPWLIGAGIVLARRSKANFTWRIAAGSLLLSFACGAVYWLKYSGIVVVFAILATVMLAQLRGARRPRASLLLGCFALYGIAFVACAAMVRISNMGHAGADLMDVSLRRNRPRDPAMLVSLVQEEAYHAGAILFTPEPGIERLVSNWAASWQWALRVPGLMFLVILLVLCARRLAPELRDMALLLAAIPMIAFPILSLAAGTRYTTAIERTCLPAWIFLEIAFLLVTSRAGARRRDPAAALLGALAAIQLLLMMWIPVSAVRHAIQIARRPEYAATPNQLYDSELSHSSVPEAIARVRSVIHGQQDVVVSATYSNRAFGTDTWIELDRLGRLLPLNTSTFPLARTQGDAGNYNAKTPFLTSKPVHVVLVASDPYRDSAFHSSVERIKSRFVQAGEWKPGPPPPDGIAEIWTADVIPDQSTGLAAARDPAR